MAFERIALLMIAAILPTLGLTGCSGGRSKNQKVDYLAKHQQRVQHYQQEVSGRVHHGAYTIPVKRKPTARDSGTTQALMYTRDVNFRFTGNIGFFIRRLSVTLQPHDPSSPVTFDNPTSFTIVAHQGIVRLSATQLSAVMNYIFAYKGSPLRHLKVSTGKGTLTLKGELHKVVWVPFTMKAPLKLKPGNVLTFKPKKVDVAKVPAGALLNIAPVKMGDLIKINRNNVKLSGNTVRLYADRLFPPPRLKMEITRIRLTPKGLILHLNDGKSPPFPKPPYPSHSYMLVDGGDVKFERSVVLNALIEIVSSTPGSGTDLDFCLYRYQNQLAKGRIQLHPNGALKVAMPNYARIAKVSREAPRG